MAKQMWKAGNMLYPLPAVMVSVADREGHANIITVAWTGTVCTNPPMVSVSVRPERYSYPMLEQTGEFVINLTCEKLAYATDYCGVKSGRDVDKFHELGLGMETARYVKAPMIAESPVNMECRVVKKEELGSHHMCLAEVLAVHVEEASLDEKGRFALEKADPIVYSHGQYFGIGNLLGSFGYSIRKQTPGGKNPEASGRKKRGREQLLRKPERQKESRDARRQPARGKAGAKKAGKRKRQKHEKNA